MQVLSKFPQKTGSEATSVSATPHLKWRFPPQCRNAVKLGLVWGKLVPPWLCDLHRDVRFDVAVDNFAWLKHTEQICSWAELGGWIQPPGWKHWFSWLSSLLKMYELKIEVRFKHVVLVMNLNVCCSVCGERRYIYHLPGVIDNSCGCVTLPEC